MCGRAVTKEVLKGSPESYDAVKAVVAPASPHLPVVDPVWREDVDQVGAMRAEGGVEQRGHGHKQAAARLLHYVPVLHDDVVALCAYKQEKIFSTATSRPLCSSMAVSVCRLSRAPEQITTKTGITLPKVMR